MRIARWLMVLVAAAAMAACGGKKPGDAAPGAAAGNGSAQSAPTGNASAEDVAEAARGDVDCPAKVATPARADGAPVDDVVGVRPGMTYEEAANMVMCTDDLMVVTAGGTGGFNIQTYGATLRQGFTARLAEPRVEKTGKQIMQEMQDDALARGGNAVRYDLKPGQSKWLVTTMGMPGAEKVIAVGREEWFPEGKNPAMGGVRDALVKKYGEPSMDHSNPGQLWIRWIYDPLGRRVTETSPLYNQCAGTGVSGGINLSPDCGVVVEAHAVPMPENPGLARSMEVGVVDQSNGYELVTATEQALEKGEQAKRAKAVEEAGKNAGSPTL